MSRTVSLLALCVSMCQLSTLGAADPLHVRIDQAIEAAQIGPQAAIATESQFLRRIYLDLTGVIPSSAEARGFLDDKTDGKRLRTIDRLLASPGFVRHMTDVLAVMLMERRSDAGDWLAFLRTSIEQNKPWNQVAAEILAAGGAEPKERGPAQFFLARDVETNLMTREVGRMFFGMDLQCAQCHNHPRIKDYLQADYYGINAFLNRTYLFKPNEKQPGVLAEKTEGDVTFKSVFTKEEGKTRPRLPGADQLKADPKQVHVAFQWKHTSPLIACAFDPKGRFLFTSAEDYTLQRWELPTGKKTSWPAHESWVRDITFLPDGETVLTAGCDDKLILWSTTAEKPQPIRIIDAHKGWIRCLSVDPQGKMIASGGNDNLVKLWNAADGKLIRTFEGHALNVYSTLIHPKGEFLLSGDQGGEIRQWEIASGKLVRKFDAKVLLTDNTQGVRYGGVRGLALSPDGKHLACCGLHKATNPLGAVNDPIVLQFDWQSAKQVHAHVADGVKGIGWQVFYLADGTLVCGSGGSGGGYLIFWKPDSDKEFHKLKMPDTLRDMDISPDGLQLATAHFDQHVRISKLTPQPNPPKKG